EKYGMEYNTNRVTGRSYTPRLAVPAWTNLFSSMPRLSTLVINEKSPRAQVSLRSLENGWVEKTITFTFDYAYRETPSDIFLYLEPKYVEKFPFISLTWITPDGRDLDLVAKSINAVTNYDFETGIRVAKLIRQNPEWEKWFVRSGQYPTPAINLLFATPHEPQLHLQSGQYQLVLKSLLFEDESDLTAELVLLGQVYGAAGTDYWRRDLVVPLLWGMPFALIIGLLGTLVTILVAMLLPAIGVWYGGWLDEFVQRLTEINMVLPGLMIAVLAYALFGINIWIVLGLVVMMNAFGSPIKTFRSALLQAREAPYIEMARSYGATDFRIITRYLVPRILPVVIPQLVSQIPGFIFLEATLGLFNIKSNYPSWGRIIYDGLARNALYGSPFWVLAPISLLLLTGLAFALLGTALERVLNPRMLEQVSQAEEKEIAKQRRVSKRMIATITAAALLMFFILVPSIKTLSGMFNRAPSTASDRMAVPVAVTLPSVTAPSPTETPDPVPQASSMLTFSPTPTLTPSPTILPSLTHTSTPLDLRPKTYTLQAGEFPYCIARRFDIDPIDLLALNGFGPAQTFYTGMTLQIPQNANPFPAQRVLRAHPATYIVIQPYESMGGIACQFGDVDPIAIAGANQLAVDSPLFVGQQLHIP
ncbi:MAG TPA: ABC transporter permease subunit, partial [Anaerolineales bacterium]|nr:ABC transporter permease subunit [Anaerolineales bacterium]